MPLPARAAEGLPAPAAVTGPHYYRSVAAYEIPFRPMAFKDTEGRPSYCVA
jgi:hypothetical protein